MTEKKNIYQRIVAVTDAIGSFTKDGKNERFNFKYAGIEGIVQALQQPCQDAGICLIQEARMLEPIQNEGKDIARCEVLTHAINIDDPDDRVTTVTAGYGFDTLDKGIYKAISGARKYAIFGLFGLHAGDEEPDAYQPAEEPQRRTSRSASASQPAQKKSGGGGILKLRTILFPDLASWPPKNDKDYDIRVITDTTGKMEWAGKSFPKKNAGALKGECSKLGFKTEDDRHSLFMALYKAFEVPQNFRVVHTNLMTTGMGSFLFDCINHAQIIHKDADARSPWTRPAPSEPEPTTGFERTQDDHSNAPPPDDGIDGEIVQPDHPDRMEENNEVLEPDMDLEEDKDFFID